MKLILTTFSFIIISFFARAQTQVSLVKDIGGGILDGYPGYKFVFKNELVFVASYPNPCDLHLFTWDEKDVRIAFDQKVIHGEIMEAGGKLFFKGDHPVKGFKLFSWNGVDTASMVPACSSVDWPTNFISLNNKLYFAGRIPTGVSQGFSPKLCMYDPVSYNMRYIANISYDVMTVMNDKIYFLANDTGNLYGQLYCYDPKLDKVVKAANYTAGVMDVSYMTVCNGKMYMVAKTAIHGNELYVYDGIKAPERITDLVPGPGSSMTGQYFQNGKEAFIIAYKGMIYFNASKNGSSRLQLYKYDPATHPSATNPALVHDVNLPVDEPCSFIEHRGKLYFQAYDAQHGNELWMYDGINTPTMVADINTGKKSSNPMLFENYGTSLYFTATTDTAGIELYRLGKQTATAIEHVSRVNEINVYPNPATNQLHFTIDLKEASAFTITLTDITGREVYSSGMQHHSAGKANVQADVSALAGGNYIYRITTSDGVTLGSGKVVKE